MVPLVAAGGGRFELPAPELVRGDDDVDAGAPAIAHLALAQGLDNWSELLADELETAVEQGGADIAARGMTLILKKNGRVGTRRLGLPDWSSLVGDVANRAAAGLDTSNI